MSESQDYVYVNVIDSETRGWGVGQKAGEELTCIIWYFEPNTSLSGECKGGIDHHSL